MYVSANFVEPFVALSISYHSYEDPQQHRRPYMYLVRPCSADAYPSPRLWTNTRTYFPVM